MTQESVGPFTAVWRLLHLDSQPLLSENPAGMNPLLQAISDDDPEIATRLLRGDHRLATALIQEAQFYNSGIFHWVYVGDTALHLAAAGYRVAIVHLLLASGADPNAAQNHRQSTPLHYAADGFITGSAWNPKRQVATLECLIRHGGNVHLRDLNGATALHRAVRTRCAAAVKILLESGSDPAAKNKPGSTAFHLAVQNTGRGGTGASAAIEAQREIIKTFLAFGVSPKLKSSVGKTVIESARSPWIQEMLAAVP